MASVELAEAPVRDRGGHAPAYRSAEASQISATRAKKVWQVRSCSPGCRSVSTHAACARCGGIQDWAACLGLQFTVCTATPPRGGYAPRSGPSARTGDAFTAGTPLTLAGVHLCVH